MGARWVVSLGLLTMLVAASAHSQSVEIELPEVVLTGVPFLVSVHPVPATDPAMPLPLPSERPRPIG